MSAPWRKKGPLNLCPTHLKGGHRATYCDHIAVRLRAADALASLVEDEHGPNREIANEDHSRCAVCAAARAYRSGSPSPSAADEHCHDFSQGMVCARCERHYVHTKAGDCRPGARPPVRAEDVIVCHRSVLEQLGGRLWAEVQGYPGGITIRVDPKMPKGAWHLERAGAADMAEGERPDDELKTCDEVFEEGAVRAVCDLEPHEGGTHRGWAWERRPGGRISWPGDRP